MEIRDVPSNTAALSQKFQYPRYNSYFASDFRAMVEQLQQDIRQEHITMSENLAYPARERPKLTLLP